MKGTVTDAETGDPIAGVSILILGARGRVALLTDDQGCYSVGDLQDGTYDVRASHVAYEMGVRRNMSLAGGGIQTADFQLARQVIEMPEIVVSAERVEQASASTTATVNILSARDIAKRNVSTLDQALESVPGIAINRSAGTATNTMSIRGASDTRGGGVGNRVLLLIDGRPAITADTGGANWGLLPMDVVERVEVVKGALSPLYGSTAMGGVVNFITKSPTDSRDTRFNMGWGCFEEQPQWMRHTIFSDVGVVHSDSYRDLGCILNLSSKRSDGYRQNTDFSLYSAYGKVQYVGERDLELGLSLGGTWLERGYPHSWLSRSHPLKIAHEKTNDRQRKHVWDFGLFLESPMSSGSKLTANLYHFRNYSRSLFNPDDLEGDDRPHGFFTDSDAKKTGALLQVDVLRLPVLPFSRSHYLILGLDAQIDAVDSNPADVMFGKHQAETVAGFAQDRIMINEAFTVMLGARYDYLHLTESSNEGRVSPKLGLLYQVNDHTALRFSLGQAFRAPSLAELYMKQEIHSGITFRENPDLRSEKLRLYAEIGASRKLSGFLRTDTSLFIYDFSDMISWKRLDEGEYQATNLSRSVVKGAETAVNVSWRGLSAMASYTYLDAQDRTEGRTDDQLPYKPKHSAYAALDYQYARLTFGVSLRYVSEVQEAVFYPNDAPDTFYTVNVKLSHDLSDRAKLSVAISNLLNRQYEEIARYRMPGRSVAFRMSVEWGIGIRDWGLGISQ